MYLFGTSSFSELLQYAVDDIGRVQAAVLRDMVSQLSNVQRLQTLEFRKAVISWPRCRNFLPREIMFL